MAVSGNLHTYQDNHALKEAVISFTVSPQITNPSLYSQLINEGNPLSGVYHKFEPVKIREFKINHDITGTNTSIDTSNVAGFKLIAFKSGKTCNIIQGLPQPRFSVFTFNTVNYEGWNSFKSDSLIAAKIIANFQNIYTVSAFSIMFIDEFYFEDEKDYVPNVLFNINSNCLPKGIEDSDFVDFNFNLRRHNNNKNYFENISIKVFTDGKRKTIRIIGNLTFQISPLPFTILLNASDLEEYLDFGHLENKKMLRDILNPKIIEIIKL